MRVVEIHESFGLSNLRASKRDPEACGPGQLRVEVRAVSLNFRDLLMVEGKYNPRQPLPLVPCSDGVGEVVGVGAGVDASWVGQRVCATFSQAWADGVPDAAALKSTLGGPLDGMLREEAVLDATGVVPAPAYLSDVEAATLPCAAVTAYNALVVQGGVKAGDCVLVLGTGGVSLFALQIAKLHGAEVWVTSSSDDKLDRAKALGADFGVNYKSEPEWGRAVKKHTGGVDHVVEVGGQGTLAQSIKATKPGGHIALIGVLAAPADVNLTPVLMNHIRVQGIFVGSKRAFVDMNRAFAQHAVRPVVDRTFPLEEARAAFAHLQSGQHMGKVVVTVGEGA